MTRFLKYVKQADEVWHAGDIGNLVVTDTIKKLKPLRAVYGNIDDDKARLEYPLNNRFMCEGVDVLITHIGGYPGKYNQAIREELHSNPPKLFICGHSHILKVMFDNKLNLLHMNPGEASVSEKGIAMFVPLVSIVLLVLANKAIKKDEDLVKSVDRLR